MCQETKLFRATFTISDISEIYNNIPLNTITKVVWIEPGPGVFNEDQFSTFSPKDLFLKQLERPTKPIIEQEIHLSTTDGGVVLVKSGDIYKGVVFSLTQSSALFSALKVTPDDGIQVSVKETTRIIDSRMGGSEKKIVVYSDCTTAVPIAWRFLENITEGGTHG